MPFNIGKQHRPVFRADEYLEAERKFAILKPLTPEQIRHGLTKIKAKMEDEMLQIVPVFLRSRVSWHVKFPKPPKAGGVKWVYHPIPREKK